jgi:shikimate 5-dehydrogenase
MLLYQGIVAFELFTKTKATNELIDIMKNALDSN